MITQNQFFPVLLITIVCFGAQHPVSLYADTEVEAGVVVPNGTIFPTGCTVNVFDGGTIGLAVDLANGELNILGGEVALGASGVPTGFTNSNNIVNISGGNIGPFFQFFSSVGSVTGGTLDTFGVFSGSEVTIDGGTVTGFPDVFGGGVINLRGGNVNSIRALVGSEINVTGTEFSIGTETFVLDPGESMVVGVRGVPFSATLTDGSIFSVFLNPSDPGFPANPVVSSAATLTIIGAEILPGDVNCDGIVNLLDVAPFVDIIINGGFSTKADLNNDGVVSLLDVDSFVNLLSDG